MGIKIIQNLKLQGFKVTCFLLTANVGDYSILKIFTETHVIE